MAIEFRDLTAETAEDLRGFFEGPAFADNSHWATCYCHAYHFRGTDEELEALRRRSQQATRGADSPANPPVRRSTQSDAPANLPLERLKHIDSPADQPLMAVAAVPARKRTSRAHLDTWRPKQKL